MGASTANVTVTAPVKVGLTATAVTTNDIRRIDFDILKEMIFITTMDGQMVEYPYDTIATLTWVIAGGVATITIST